jgi:hypothetical protein
MSILVSALVYAQSCEPGTCGGRAGFTCDRTQWLLKETRTNTILKAADSESQCDYWDFFDYTFGNCQYVLIDNPYPEPDSYECQCPTYECCTSIVTTCYDKTPYEGPYLYAGIPGQEYWKVYS